MDTYLDWSTFQRGPVGPERAFEAFVAKLLERMVRREHGQDVSFYALNSREAVLGRCLACSNALGKLPASRAPSPIRAGERG